MVFVGSIWKSKSGWFLFVMSLGLSVATQVLLTAGHKEEGLATHEMEEVLCSRMKMNV
jgi:hypothetical protein